MSLTDRSLRGFDRALAAEDASAHCDIPCGIYDPHAAQIAALTVIRMVQLIQNAAIPGEGSGKAEWDAYGSTMSRYTAVKESHAAICEQEIIILWSDYFKPEHLEKVPDLHDLVWKTAKLCSTVKQKIDMEASQALLAGVQKIAEAFWLTKGVGTRRQSSLQTVGGELVYPVAP